MLSSLPLYHINGQVIATLAPFVSGGTIIAPHRFSASQWWGHVETYGATWVNMVPTIIAYLLAAPADSRRYPRVRFGRSASAPLPPAHHREFEARFGFPVIEASGSIDALVTGRRRGELERAIARFLPGRRWFAGKARRILAAMPEGKAPSG